MKRALLLSMLTTLPMTAHAGNLTISGISSGGFMASQMATIYSDAFSGVATVAGGVFFCAENKFQETLQTYGTVGYFNFTLNAESVLRSFGWGITDRNSSASTHEDALTPLPSNPIYQPVGVCMRHPEAAHSPETLNDGQPHPMNLDFLNELESKGLIAPTRNIAKQRVFIYQGRQDQVVQAAMATKLKEFYSRLGVSSSDLKLIVASGNHNFPTDRKDGIDCDESRFPFIASCKRDLAGEILEHLLDRRLSKAAFNILHLRKIEQREAPSSLASYGYIYATPYCLNNPSACDLHVALHGCQMSDDYDPNFQNLYQSKVQFTHILGLSKFELSSRHPQMGGLSFARRSGYAEYAEDVSNHLMILFPQTRISTDNYPANPNGCWDWFGWTGADYATNRGSETAWLMSYVQKVRQNPKSFFMTQIKNAH